MITKILPGLVILAACGQALAATPEEQLPLPKNIVADMSIPEAQRQEMALAARRYYAFWHTGESRYMQAALANDFMDRNLPAGRPQGPEGPLFASKNFRAAVPDLQLEVEEMLLVGDRVIGRLHFSGHYSGSFHGRQGDGRKVDFIATDIYRIAQGKITDNWHLEDNLTLLQQLGVVK
ncbi:ester cyclase [Undibacterium sp. TS12]|uniref:ester cyclase n=1 Tax=Undibacterium sp. TS12 TaxID=2908202 RepID=UPI001F4D2215|nr:ester cyclase [Undibacterium sp. TS12]MCH8617888.1 ester cyclase [Undibacterium sp. TS12]